MWDFIVILLLVGVVMNGLPFIGLRVANRGSDIRGIAIKQMNNVKKNNKTRSATTVVVKKHEKRDAALLHYQQVKQQHKADAHSQRQ